MDDEFAQLSRLAAFLAWLTAGYGLTRTSIHLGFPSDALPADAQAVVSDLAAVYLLGAVLFWLTRVHDATRFEWLSCSAWPLVFLVVSTFFGALNEVHGLDVSMVSPWGPVAWAVLGLAFGCTCILFGLTVVSACKLELRACTAYFASRFGVGCFVLAQVCVATKQRPIHVHHYYIGFILATMSAFNDSASGALLAVGCGLMTQGIATYRAAPLFRTPCT